MITYLKKDLSKLFNIGDSLCTPDNYFDIKSEKNFRIIGGGVWNIEKYGIDENAQNTILWAAGKSIKEFNKIRAIDTSSFRYADWSIRDLDLLDDKTKFVPCVSCLNTDVISEPIGNKTLVFTNANTTVSPDIKITESEDIVVMKNDETYSSFIEKWKHCDKIITNSYHGIYWSMLSGRAVAPYGYSSKFTSVTRLFNIEFPKENLYNLKAQEVFNYMIKRNQNYVSIKNYNKTHVNFCDINFEYAKKLSKIGIKCDIKTT